MIAASVEWIAAVASQPDSEWKAEAVEPLADPQVGIAAISDEEPSFADPDLWIYRDRTVALLRRYERMALEIGRLPSLLGREFFRTQVTSYSAHTFEDSVIFVHDIERCLELLNQQQKEVIAITVLQEYSQSEAAGVLGMPQANIWRRFVDAVDRVSEIFLQRKILERVPEVFRNREKSCQGGEIDDFSASNSN